MHTEIGGNKQASRERGLRQNNHARELNAANIEMKNRKKESKVENFNKYRFFNKGNEDE
jgi:hypothetical protein